MRFFALFFSLGLTACIHIGDQADYFRGLKGQSAESLITQLGYPNKEKKMLGDKRVLEWDFPNSCHVDAEIDKTDKVVGVSWYGDRCPGTAVVGMRNKEAADQKKANISQ